MKYKRRKDFLTRIANPKGHKTGYSLLLSSLYRDKDKVVINSPNIQKVLDTMMRRYLKTKARDVLKMRYGVNKYFTMTLQEIADKYDISRERVRQIEERALDELRNPESLFEIEKHLTLSPH